MFPWTSTSQDSLVAAISSLHNPVMHSRAKIGALVGLPGSGLLPVVSRACIRRACFRHTVVPRYAGLINAFWIFMLIPLLSLDEWIFNRFGKDLACGGVGGM